METGVATNPSQMNIYLERLRKAINEATVGMTAAQLSHHPEGKWCAGEILEHLSLTYIGTIKGCEKSLQAGRPLAGSPTFYQKVAIFLVTGAGYLPSGRESPKTALPKGASTENILSELDHNIDTMDRAITACEIRYGKKTPMMDHPILGPLTSQEWRKFHLVHGKHHLKQILVLRESSA
ncbi:MAG TPA: DUF1569 domain-containing protein [Terriglobales bacterium]|jgi:hypothetical protein